MQIYYHSHVIKISYQFILSPNLLNGYDYWAAISYTWKKIKNSIDERNKYFETGDSQIKKKKIYNLQRKLMTYSVKMFTLVDSST